MWTIFNPINEKLEYTVNHAQWTIGPGETKKFPDEVGEYIKNLHGFLEVLAKDESQPQKTFLPPKDLSTVEEAQGELLRQEDRNVKHPTSDPEVIKKSNFMPDSQPESFSDHKAGLGLNQMVKGGKLVQIDKDGVEWYGKGAQKDNPFSR